jgi:hypothetical protein
MAAGANYFFDKSGDIEQLITELEEMSQKPGNARFEVKH